MSSICRHDPPSVRSAATSIMTARPTLRFFSEPETSTSTSLFSRVLGFYAKPQIAHLALLCVLRMGKAKKGPKFAVMKKVVTKKAIKNYKEEVLNPKKKDLTKEKLPRNVPNVSAALFFQYNTALGPPYRVLVDTNFINFSIQNKIDLNVIKYQNQKLSQKLETQKVEYSALQNELSQLKKKQLPYDPTLTVVNKSWKELVKNLESCSIRSRKSTCQQRVEDNSVVRAASAAFSLANSHRAWIIGVANSAGFERNHWLLAAINTSASYVYYFDPIGDTNVNSGMKSMVEYAFVMCNAQMGRKNKKVCWEVVKCPRQPGIVECGFYVMKFMKEIIKISTSAIVEKFIEKEIYSQEEVDIVRVEWADQVEVSFRDDSV